MKENFSISHTTKRKPPRLRFAVIKDAVLGKTYDLSLVFVGKAKMKQLNKTYRSKDYATDILSFPLSESAGEIYICTEVCEKKAKEFERKMHNYLEFLFIHGCVHLLGHNHGPAMDKLEQKFQKKFSL